MNFSPRILVSCISSYKQTLLQNTIIFTHKHEPAGFFDVENINMAHQQDMQDLVDSLFKVLRASRRAALPKVCA